MTKHIYIYSPSGAVRDKAAFKRGIARLEAFGHCVEVDEAALNRFQRFAGDDQTRLAAIHRAADSGADVALISRGGYGLTRILPVIDYAKIATAIEHGTQFVGISDFTAFQNAVLTQTGSVTWAGPALCEGFGVRAELPDDIMLACFDDLMLGQGQGAGWRQNRHILKNATNSIAINAYPSSVTGTFDVENSVLWGGNLTVLTSLMGTPYFPNIDRGILFVEDVAEHPYRIERMMTQLLYAGVLARQNAIVMGQFTDFKLQAHDHGFRLQTVVDWLRSQLDIPILTNLPYGHIATKVLLPVGASVDVSVDGRDAMIFWGHGSYASH